MLYIAHCPRGLVGRYCLFFNFGEVVLTELSERETGEMLQIHRMIDIDTKD